MNLFSEPSFYHTWLRNGTYAAPAMLFGLLVIWALFSQASWLKRRWYLRIAIPLAAVVLVLPTGMCEVALYALSVLVVVLLQIVLLGAAIFGWRYLWRLGTRQSIADLELESASFRFGLGDALIATALMAVGLALGSYAVRSIEFPNWEPLLFASFAHGNVLIITAGAAFLRIPFRWIQWGCFALWFPLAFALCYLWAATDWLAMRAQYDWSIFVPPPHIFETTAFNVSFASAFGLLVVILSYRFAFAPRNDSGQLSSVFQWLVFAERSLAGFVLLILFTASLLPSLWLYFLLLTPAPQLDRSVVDGNAYIELDTSLRKLDAVVEPADYDAVTKDELTTIVSAHRDDLQSIRVALTKPCRKVLPLEQDALGFDFPSINGSRCYARICLAQGRFMENDGDLAGASQRYMQPVELGHALRNGGLRIDALVGIAIESLGLEELRRLRDDMDTERQYQLLERLQQLDVRQESQQQVDRRERAFQMHVGGDKTRLAYAIDEMACEKNFDGNHDVDMAIARSNIQRRLLFTELALLAYQQEHGEYPVSLKSLVPEYLDAVPIDPFSDQPLIYQPDGDGFIFYSVGLDGEDDGGEFVSRLQSTVEGQGDYFLDASDLDDEEEF